MNNPIVTILGDCIQAIQSGELSIEDCLDRYPEYQTELESLLRIAVDLNDAPKARPSLLFMQTARQRLIRKIKPVRQPSLLDWLTAFLNTFQTNRLAKTVTVVVVLVFLLFSSVSSFTVYAAQDAMPGDFLYPVKLGVEDFQIAVASQDRAIDLHLEFANERQEELKKLEVSGRSQYIETVEQYFQTHLEKASQIIADQPSEQVIEKKIDSEKVNQAFSQHLQVLRSVLDQASVAEKPLIEKVIDSSSKNRRRIDQILASSTNTVPSNPGSSSSGSSSSQGSYASPTTAATTITFPTPTLFRPSPTSVSTIVIIIPPTPTNPVVVVPILPPPTSTRTPTRLPTSTPTATRTPTPIPTFTPTDTATPLPTNTATPLPTDTPTPIPTDTATPIPPTATPIPQPTDTPTDIPILPSDTPPANINLFGLTPTFPTNTNPTVVSGPP